MTSETRPTLTPRITHLAGISGRKTIGIEASMLRRDFSHLLGFDRIDEDQGQNRTVNLKLAAWNGHEFEILSGACYYNTVSDRPINRFTFNFGGQSQEDGGGTERELAMDIYFPIDSRIIEADVKGAVRAYPNETNTGWLFAHTDEGTHHDYELTLMGAIDGVFQPFFRALQVEMLAAAETTRRDAAADFRRLSDFYGAVLVQARTLARTAFLGEREQKAHPREGWLDRDITMAIKRVKLAWTGNRDYDLSELASALAYVEGRLAMPSVETRWVRAARLAAEAGDDSTTDFEYVYTSQVGSSPVTGAANLPDPTWNYDQLTVPTTRGTHVYSDGEPDLHVVRFKRRVPTGTESGADVGTIAWEQEPAYKP